MNQEETICHYIYLSLSQVEKMINTGEVDATSLANRLHRIRSQAQKMENGLKLRKELMVKHGIEDEYQKLKKKRNTPTGINNIAETDERYIDDSQEYEVTVFNRTEERMLYQNTVKAGVLCFVETISDIDEQGVIDGQTQKLTFGHPLAGWFAFDQLKQYYENRYIEILALVREAVSKKQFGNTKFKKKTLKALKKMGVK